MMDAGFEARHLYAACRLTFTHNYSPGHSRGTTFGTAFIVGFPEGDSRFGLVTNRHLVDIPWGEPECVGTTIESIKVEMWQSINLKLTFEINDPKPAFHDDPSIDVAVVPFGPAFDTSTTLGTFYDKIENLLPDRDADHLAFTYAMSWQHLLKCERLWPQLRPGEFVLFPGYPIWYDKSQTRPVFRSGLLASDPHTDYRRYDGEPTNDDGNRQILFDAFSTSGNSGSPVFVAQRGLAPLQINLKTSQDDSVPQQAAKMEFTPYHEPFLIGVNAGHFDAHANDHAGLSRMFKLSAIMDILRSNTSPSTDAPRATVLIREENPSPENDLT
jgi:hypothetical protein